MSVLENGIHFLFWWSTGITRHLKFANRQQERGFGSTCPGPVAELFVFIEVDVASDAVTGKVGVSQRPALAVEGVAVPVRRSREQDKDVGSRELGLLEVELGHVAPDIEGAGQHPPRCCWSHVRREVLDPERERERGGGGEVKGFRKFKSGTQEWYTERQKKLITSSGRRSLKSTASKLIIFGHK